MENVHAKRLRSLRAVMRQEGVDALIIPTADYHGSEYVADCFRARAWISGFTGSAGTLLVLAGGQSLTDAGAALLWTDGRYYIQAEQELDGSGVILMKSGEAGVPTLQEYLREKMPAGGVLAFDGRCMTAAEGRELRKQLRPKRVSIHSDRDLVGAVWTDRPDLPSHPVWILDAARYAGETAESKLSRLRERMARKGASAFVSGKLDEIMWLYNLRGNDVECNPVALSYTVVTAQTALLYLQETEVTEEVRRYLKEIPVELHPYEDFFEDLGRMRFDLSAGEENPFSGPGPAEVSGPTGMKNGPVLADPSDMRKLPGKEREEKEGLCGALSAGARQKGRFVPADPWDDASDACSAGICPLPRPQAVKIWYDPENTSYAVDCALHANLISLLDLQEEREIVVDVLLQEHFIENGSPLTAMKAVRNETEITNFRSCYLEDSAVLTKFIYWLKKTVKGGSVSDTTLEHGKIRELNPQDTVYAAPAVFGSDMFEKNFVLTESAAAAKLDGMRAKISDFVELSFGTISAYGSNAAMMHYEPGEDGGAVLRPEGMYLVDSGAHYLRGTTDVTRTIALGPVTDEMRRDYTLTAMAQLRMMDTVFLAGCDGMTLDIMAREVMWRNGMDYKCGTGHGIGYLLNVHEGPHSLRWRARGAAEHTPFEPGMIVSDEPGVYKSGRKWDQELPYANPMKRIRSAEKISADENCAENNENTGVKWKENAEYTGTAGSGKDTQYPEGIAYRMDMGEPGKAEDCQEGSYGIRIETILLCRDWGTTPDGHFLCFEPLTFVPLDPGLIDPGLLSPDDRASLNRYHAQVYQKLAPFLEEEERLWLAQQCREIGSGT